MNQYRRDNFRVGEPVTRWAGATAYCLIRLMVTIILRGKVLAIGLAGLGTLLGPTGLCLAASSDRTGRSSISPAETGRAASGIRDPMNPDQYLRELAGRLNSPDEASAMLRGMSVRPSSGGLKGSSIAKKPGWDRQTRGGFASTLPRGTSRGWGQPSTPRVSSPRPVSSPSAWNGLSSENGAAKRGLAGINLNRPAGQPGWSELTPNRRPDAGRSGWNPATTPRAPQGVQPSASGQSRTSSASTRGGWNVLSSENHAARRGLPAPVIPRSAVQPPEPEPVPSPDRAVGLRHAEAARPSERPAPAAQGVTDAEQGWVPPTSAEAVWNSLSPEKRAAQPAPERPVVQTPVGKPADAEPSCSEPEPPQATPANTSEQTPPPMPNTFTPTGYRLALWTEPSAANLASKTVASESQARSEALRTGAPWSLAADLDKYRAHAVKEGSRDSGESLKKAFERAGLTLEDGVNVFVLGYASERGKAFRGNDGKGLLDEPGKVPQQAGATIASLGDGLYSIADLVTLNSLPDVEKDVYTDNNPIVRPLVFTGRTIGGAWKTTEEIGNAVTWGYFDNVTGCVGLVIEDVIELLKHAGQAATNLVRLPVQLVAGKKEGTERVMDWVLLVPLEFVSNTVEMKGIANMDDYKTAFAEKGVIGSILELGGSSYIVYRAVDELIDELDDNHRHRKSSGDSTPDTPADPPSSPGTWTGEVMFFYEGEWSTLVPTEGGFFLPGQWPGVSIKYFYH